MIESASNPQMKYIRRLLTRPKTRREDGVFLVEGVKMVREAPRDRLVRVYCSETFAGAEEHAGLIRETGAEEVKDAVFRSISDTVCPQGILAIVKQQTGTPEDILRQRKPVVILESLQDPGNLGTILRTGEGAGIGGVLMNRETADLYNPKTVRATMGSIYRVPCAVYGDLNQVAEALHASGYRLFAAHLAGRNNYTEEDYREPCAFLIGNEGNGLTEEAASLADVLVRIPMEGHVESLNASVAAALLMYEAHRQRCGG